jgi:hypothetical protein
LFSKVFALSCMMSNRNSAARIDTMSTAELLDWTAGSGNTVGIIAVASNVYTSGTMPQGATARVELVGGLIRP